MLIKVLCDDCRAMAQLPADVFDVNVFFQKQCGRRVPQIMCPDLGKRRIWMGFVIGLPNALHDVIDFMRRIGNAIIITEDESIIMEAWADLHPLAMIEEPELREPLMDIPRQHNIVVR